MALLELRGIAKHFGAIEALKGVDLSVGAGEVVGLMGDNGAGKSTLVRIIAGNFRPSEGEICLKGEAGRCARGGDRGRLPGPGPLRQPHGSCQCLPGS
jgi:ABC-type sugar transport system ATPase subunit